MNDDIPQAFLEAYAGSLREEAESCGNGPKAAAARMLAEHALSILETWREVLATKVPPVRPPDAVITINRVLTKEEHERIREAFAKGVFVKGKLEL